MTDLPVITRVLTREDGKTVQWPALVFLHCETTDWASHAANDRGSCS